MKLILKIHLYFALIFFFILAITACSPARSNPIAGRTAGKNKSSFNPVSQKSQPVPKKFVIKRGSKTYLGQINPK